ITAGENVELLLEQAKRYKPNTIVIANESKCDWLKSQLAGDNVKVFGGIEAIEQCVEMESIDIVLTAMVGFAGLKPTLRAINAGKNIALANKETLVVAGEIVTKLAKEKGVNIYPVDSEHSAIFQCLLGEFHNPIEKIYLTASGGPFRGKSIMELSKVTKSQALKHPNWDMGAKITIDSASMMNKGLEIIEAKWLFNLTNDQIDVIVHPQSIIHSIVQFTDGSMKAQMGLPDMKLPIQFALAFPNRIKSDFERFDFLKYPNLSFESPDEETFKNLGLARRAMKEGSNMPCVLNAANEIAVECFLSEKIGFLGIADLNEQCLDRINKIESPDLQQLIECDTMTRELAKQLVNENKITLSSVK
ncbi:MAG: 1-deoxy-D-xylulose-5-phosphate reductoisomerase, partial [Chitinophagales bacterium]|nr:1-deoxy-D-xylulose-5-phosphate reductoisomerase [Chitinophagales bacterium]